MYSYIEGKLAEKNPAFVIIDVNGIGYMVHISLHTYSFLKDKEKCKLLLHHVVREDAQLLYGFMEEEERNLFQNLISVSGIGANTARLILSSFTPVEIQQAIVSKNVSLLKSIKGIGVKSAERIIVDLKDKFEKVEISTEKFTISHNTIKQEALTGLTILGFSKVQAEKAVDKILQTASLSEGEASLKVEVIIRKALKIL
jgi:Holliday junction DNA helicase RuvA